MRWEWLSPLKREMYSAKPAILTTADENLNVDVDGILTWIQSLLHVCMGALTRLGVSSFHKLGGRNGRPSISRS